jgi:hypothetical protein
VAGDITPRHGAVTKYVAQTTAEPVAHLDDALVRGAGGLIGVAAVFDQRDLGIRRTQDMVVRLVHGPVEPV